MQPTMRSVRPAQLRDLTPLLTLFAQAEVSAVVESLPAAERIWEELIGADATTVFVCEARDVLVATCTLITAPNLLRGGRRHGFLENVVTHPAHRGAGHGRAVVGAALEAAWRQGCHHVLLQSGRADERVHRFYEHCGFVPGLRTAYAVRNPAVD